MLRFVTQIAGLICLTTFATSGFAQRPAWTTSRVQGRPTPPLPYRTQRVFGDFEFNHPVTFTSAPGTSSMFLLEQHGRVYEFTSETSSEPRLIVDLATAVPQFQAAYGLEFHPGFPQNRQVYICYIRQGTEKDGTRLSRFRMRDTTPMRLEPDSEQVLITWQKGGHNGGCVKFGPDGFLYVSTGDAAAPFPPDPEKVGQDISNLLSTIFRIDVDHPGKNRPYSVPPDNPFVNLETARPEIYAYGFRNPWRMAFDRETGDLWVGDVGWELWEMIYDIRSGGNYGWPIVEGPKSLHPNDPRGPTPILKPAASHSHVEARSITGGQVYYSDRLPELKGAYLYGDHVTGRMWKLRKQNGEIHGPVEIARAPLQIICFGLHNNGEVYIVDYAGGIYRLVRSESIQQNQTFPRKLSASDCSLIPPGSSLHRASYLIPSMLNHGWMAPRRNDSSPFPGINRSGSTSKAAGTQIGTANMRGSWKFPQDSVLGKTLSVEGRRIETQLMHYDGQAWQAYSYLWNDAQTDAVLAADKTHTIEFTVDHQMRRWLVSSRSDCMICHSNANDMLLGFKPEQLRGPKGSAHDQLAHLEKLGLFEEPPAARVPINDPTDELKPLETRVRAYLHVNCAHCHRRNGGGSVPMDVVYRGPLEKTRLVDELPTQGTFGIENARVVAPGAPSAACCCTAYAKREWVTCRNWAGSNSISTGRRCSTIGSPRYTNVGRRAG